MYESIPLYFLLLALAYALALSQKGVSVFLRILPNGLVVFFSSVCQWIPSGIKYLKKSSYLPDTC
jgi:hypothetical protein